jgi:hypothetical protein
MGFIGNQAIPAGSAATTSFDNTESGLVAETVEEAINALDNTVDTISTDAARSGDNVTLSGDVTGNTTVSADGSIAITTTVVDNSHNHSFSNITATPTTVDGYGITDAVQEGDSVTLSGDVTGTAVFDSDGNVNIAVTVVDDSHDHIISNVDGLQDALDNKLDDAQLIDDDTMATATSANIPSAESVKAYVDSVAAGQDTASDITVTPVGSIGATDVQAALAELDSEKVAKTSVNTSAVTLVTFNADGTITIEV